MKLYKVVHKSIAKDLVGRPLAACSHHSKLPYIQSFDSIAMAILEHPLCEFLPDLQDRFRILEYYIPDDSVQKIEESRRNLYDKMKGGRPKYGDWVWRFLIKEAALVAQIPSTRWQSGSKYIINPKHPAFDKVYFKEVRPGNS